jgi:urea carboxylase system permease
VTTTTSPVSAEPDALDLAEFGYPQQLHRRLGSYASFAAGFSFVSILTTVFQLFGLGYTFGGPAFFFTWPLVFAGQLLVALTFAELASRYPIAGCIYQWSRRLSSGVYGWFAGWFMLIGQIISVSAAAIALQVVLPSVWTGFQIVHGDSTLTSKSGATNAVVLGVILIAVTTTISALGVRIMSLINSVGVTCELAGVALLVVLLFSHSKRGPGVVLHTEGVQGNGSYIWPFLVSGLMAAYVMYGFDSAGELAEETRQPRRTAPLAIIRALVVSGVGGALLLLAALMASPSLGSDLGNGGLSYVLTSSLGSGVGKALLVDVAIAICVCTLAIQTAATRMTYSMARDGVLPGSARLARVSERTGTPILPTVLIGVVSAAILGVNVGQAQLFTALTSVAVVIVYLAYLLVTFPMLVRRISGPPAEAAPGQFSLGRMGLIVNVGAVLYGAGMIVNMAWPRSIVYDPAGGTWYLKWFAELLLGGALVLGAAIYWTRRARGSSAVVVEPLEAAV